jgi:hypothetical protein
VNAQPRHAPLIQNAKIVIGPPAVAGQTRTPPTVYSVDSPELSRLEQKPVVLSRWGFPLTQGSETDRIEMR